MQNQWILKVSDHGSSRDGVGGGVAAAPGADHILTGGENVDDGTVVGEGCASVGDGRSTNSDSVGNMGRASVGGIDVRVSGCDLCRELKKCCEVDNQACLLSCEHQRQ